MGISRIFFTVLTLMTFEVNTYTIDMNMTEVWATFMDCLYMYQQTM